MNTTNAQLGPDPTSESSRTLALSPSRAQDYYQCPLRYRFRAIDKLPEPKTQAQVKGTLVHAVLEKMHKLPREQRLYPDMVKQLKPTWAELCVADTSLCEVVPDAELYPFLQQCRELLRGYFQMENPQGFDAVGCEIFITTTLPNGVPIRGFIDRVDKAPTGEIRVVDYKTGKKPLPRWSKQAKYQMLFYALAYWRIFGVIPDQLRLMYLKVADSIYLVPAQDELEDFEHSLEQLWQQIVRDATSGNFTPTKNPLCGWCSHQKLCPLFGGTPPEYSGGSYLFAG